MSGRQERQRALANERERVVVDELRRSAARRRWAEQAEQFDVEMAAQYAHVPPPPPVIPEPPLLLSRRLEDVPSAWEDDPDGTQELPLLGPPSNRQRSWQEMVQVGSDGAGPVASRPRHHAPGAWAGELPVRTDRTLTALLAGFMVVAVGAVAATWFLLAREQQQDAVQAAAAGQRTLLMLVTGERQAVLGGAVLGADTTKADAVLLPGSLRLNVPGRGATSLSTALRDSSAAPAEALSNTLGVRIDGTWVLSLAGLSSLVDSLGGVRVEIDQGERLLDGQQAAAGLTDPDRFATVVMGLLAGLDDDREVLSAQVAALGQQTSTTLPAQQLTGLLLALHQAAARSGLTASVMPVGAVGAAGAGGIDEARAGDVVAARLPGARLKVPPGGVVQVLVRNGVGVPGLNAVARTRLLSADLRYTGGGNARTFGQGTTQVLVPGSSAADLERGRAVAQALGVPESSVRADQEARQAGVVVVLLGADFADSTDRAPTSIVVSASR